MIWTLKAQISDEAGFRDISFLDPHCILLKLVSLAEKLNTKTGLVVSRILVECMQS